MADGFVELLLPAAPTRPCSGSAARLLLAGAVVAGVGACALPGPGGPSAGQSSDDRQGRAGSPVAEADQQVTLGAAVLLEESPAWLRTERLALLTNQASRVQGESLAVRLAAAGNLVRLLAPEHGFDLAREAGAAVQRRGSVALGDVAAVDVRSWYGVDAQQRVDDLQGIDVLLFDLPDVGARYFTYIGTMRLAMQAAAAAGVRFVVLDRPNPLGGELVSGWIAEDAHRSLVASVPVPILHGMTIGELARMIRGEGWIDDAPRLDLAVVPMRGWIRAMRWPQTHLPWFAASPNLPSFDAALVYGGACLLEGTTLSEGRGTEDSFLQFGAPGLDNERLLRSVHAQGEAWANGSSPLSGVMIQPVLFEPRSMKGRAESPRFVGEKVRGLRIEVVDAAAVRPLELGVALLRGVVEEVGVEALDADWLTALAGTKRLADLLREGASSRRIVSSWQAEVERFRIARRPYLLYS